MSYRGRLTVEAQDQLRYEPTRSVNSLTEEQIAQLSVDDVDVSPTTPDAYLEVNCSLPVIEPGEGVVKVKVTLDQRTALRILFNAPLDETNVPRPSRRPIRDVVAQQNQRFYDSLRRSADDQR